MKIDGTPYQQRLGGRAGPLVRSYSGPDEAAVVARGILRLTTRARGGARHCARCRFAARPLIGAVAAYGLALALRADASSDAMEAGCSHACPRRGPTAVNLRWAIERMLTVLRNTRAEADQRAHRLCARRLLIADEDAAQCEAIGEHGASTHRRHQRQARPGLPVNVLTHCNAGWLATVDWGTALAPIYKAHDSGIRGACLGGRDAAPASRALRSRHTSSASMAWRTR